MGDLICLGVKMLNSRWSAGSEGSVLRAVESGSLFQWEGRFAYIPTAVESGDKDNVTR